MKTLVKPRAVRIFISYAHEDKGYREQLQKHLKSLENGSRIIVWYDREILPGSRWSQKIADEIHKADIILLLISADFLASTYVRDEEIPLALNRLEFDEGKVEVVPIILRPVAGWGDNRLSDLQALPTDGQSVAEFETPDHAYRDIVQGLGRLIEKVSTDAGETTEGPPGPAAAPPGQRMPIAKERAPLAGGPPDDPVKATPVAPFLKHHWRRIRLALLVGWAVGMAIGLAISLMIVPPLSSFEPVNAVAYNLRGEIYLRIDNNADAAIADFREATRREPMSPRFHHNLGLAYLAARNYPAAAKEFEKAIEVNKTCLEAHNDLCIAFASQGKYAEANEILRKAGDIVSDHPWTLKNQGFILYMQGDYGGAVAKYSDAIRKDPNYFEAYLYRGWAHSHMGREYESRGDLYHAISGDRALDRRVDPKPTP